MRKDKTKRNLINKILTISMSLVLFVTAVFTICSLFVNKTVEESEYSPITSTYSSNQVHIVNPNVPSSAETVTMTEAYDDISVASNKTILITTDDELYLFSLACSENPSYLSKSYRLASNIYYETDDQFIPVGYNGTPFSGTFDGNGYEISNLEMVSITSQINNESSFANMYYYAMFSDNTGTIKNLGIVESRNAIVSIELDKIVTSGGVANLVGHNQSTGKVQNCYYRDLRDMIDDEIGLAIYGQYRIAGLVYLNDGTFTDSYVAVSTVVNHKINGYESICGICYQDNNYNASTSNLYYYDGSIATYREITGGIEITYKDEVFSDATFLNSKQNVGKYCSEIEPKTGSLSEIDLNYYYQNNATWYIPDDYGDLNIYVKNPTPILRGLDYTKNGNKYTFAIDDVDDFIYMFELMNGSDLFAGDAAIYSINSDINLKSIDSSQYIYKKIITATITGAANAGTINPTLINNSASTYPSIYNFNCIDAARKTTTLGIDAYGLLPFFGGTISNLNIIPDALDLSTIEATNNVKGIAALSGYAEKATIDNVNVYITTTHLSKDIKEFYLGSVVGVLGGESSIENCTASGSYQMAKFSIAKPSTTAYTGGIAIGGVVGYICETYGSIENCLSAVDMQLNMDAPNVEFAIGGVVGAAYTIEAKELENIGSIAIGTSDYSAKYNNIYVAGVIGRHFGVKKEVESLTNQGAVSIYGYPNSATSNIAYVSGVENADILTSSVANTGLIASSLKSKDGKYKFVASGLTNRANVSVNHRIIADSTEYTSGINVFSRNGFVSELTGVYNLNYTYKYSGANKVKATLGDQTIDTYLAHKYAGAVNVINGSTPNANAIANLNTVYNLRNIAITTSTAVGSFNFEYYGTVRGKYINYNDVRNEGDITLTATKTLGTANTSTTNIILAGVFEEVSEGCSADNIFNGGNISLKYSDVNINGNVFASGICYKNKGYDATTINQYNPSLNEFDSKAKGAINNAINNGTITVDNPTNFAGITYNYDIILSPNGQSYLGSLPTTTYGTIYNIAGDLFVSGITVYNEAPITNTFNLTDLFASNYITNTTDEKEINVAGLVGLNIGQYAYILNSANNGNLKGINLSSTDGVKSNVNVSGIIARNDENEDGSNYSSSTTNPHSKQIVSFTINYGDIFSYNFRQNIATTAYEPSSKASGIVAMGLLNTINVMNYGNIYGSETASGIFGIMYFTRFESEVSATNKVYIANTINYGNVYMLSRGYNNAHTSASIDYQVIQYSRFKALTTSNIKTDESTVGDNEAFTSVVRNSDYISIIGSVFAVANYATSSAAGNIKIRYLISFNEQCQIVGETVAAPSGVSADTSTLFSAHISSHAGTGAYLNDKWINNYVEYAPLSTGSTKGKFVTSIDAATGNASTATKTYYGIFNSNFTFSKAILGKITLDLTTNPTDAYLTDYFQFVGFQYINPILFEKIGWQTFAYQSAADDFATNVSNVIKVLDKATTYDSYKTIAKSAFTWMNNSVSSDLDVVIDSMIAEENYSDLLSVLQYIYSNDSQSNIYIDKTLRTNVLNKLISSDDELLSVLDEVLNYKNGYSTALAKSIVVNEDEVKTYISNYINNLSSSDLSSMLADYIDYLDDTNNDYFNYETSEKDRISLLTTLFASIDDSTFYSELISILGISDSSVTDSTKMLIGYQQMSTADKKTLFETIVTYNYTQNRLDEYLDDMASEVDFYSELNANGYNISSMSDMYTRAELISGSSATGESIIDERVKLWNLIKNTNVFRNNYSTFSIPSTTYFKATEYNNTYQSITEPHNDGAYTGATSENRLSYMYTTVITPQVYFYGPYTGTDSSHTTGNFSFSDMTAKENTAGLGSPIVNYRGLNVNNSGYQNKYFSVFHYDDNSLWSSTELMKSRGNRVTYATALSSSGNHTYPYPVLIYYDYNNEQLGGANGTYTTDTSWYSGDFGDDYSYRGFSDTQQFKYDKNATDPMIGGTTKYTTNDWTGTLFGANDWYMKVSSTGETFSLNHAVLAKAYSSGGKNTVTLANGSTIKTNAYRCYIQDSDGAYHLIQTGSNNSYDANATIQIGKMENNTFVAKHTMKNYNGADNTRKIYSLISYIAGLRMYTSTASNNATTGLHSTGRTGVYRRSGGWNNYFTWKQGDETKVYTSQYIDYEHSDLFNLDGVLTEYDGATYSNDEREIINYLFNNYFLNTSTKCDTFKRLAQAALLESLGSNTTRGAAYIDNFMMNNIYTSARTNLSNSIPFVYLYEQYNYTVFDYLENLFNGTNPNNKQLVIYGASGNQSKYIELLKRLKAANDITSNNDYANLATFLAYLRQHPSYISNDKIVLSNLSSMSLSDLTTYLSLFDDTSKNVTISNLYDLTGKMTSYTGTVTYNQSTYSSTTYSYGLKFSSMTLTPASTDTRIIMIAKSTGASSTLTKGNDTVTVTTVGEYYFETNGATSVTITSDSDVIVYTIYFVQDIDHTNQQTNLNGTVLDSNQAKYFTITKNEIEAQINTAIINAIGNNTYYKITTYSVVANVTLGGSAGDSTPMYFAGSKTPTSVYPNTQFTWLTGQTTNTTLNILDEYYNQTIFAVQNTNGYTWSLYRYITGVSYTITYSYLSAGTLGTTNKTATSSTVNLYDSNVVSGQTYNNTINVNANNVTLPTKATLQSAIAAEKSVDSSHVVITAFSATFTLRNSWNYSTGLRIYDSSNSNNLGSTSGSISSGQTGTVTVADLSSYYGQQVNGRYYYSSYYQGNTTIVSYSYTVTYRIDSNSVSITLPTLSNVQALATADSGIANPTITASSITITARNRLESAYTLYLYDNSANSVISNFGSVAANSTASVIIDLTSYYGKSVSVRFYQNNNYYTESTKAFVFDSYYYTATYQAPDYAVSSALIYKNRLLNLDVNYSDVQNSYFSYVMRNSSTAYNTFVKENLVNFAAYNTSGNDSNPINLFVNKLNDTQKKEFARLVITNSNEGMYGAIKALAKTNASLATVLKTMDTATDGYAFIADAVYKLDNTIPSGSSTDLIDQHPNLLKTLVAAYIVANYRSTLNQGKTAYNTDYYNLVVNLNSNATGSSTSGTAFKNNINYINSDGSFTATKFDLFTEYVLGQKTATSSYGIFALSSSRGIQNGAFIPDNVSLASMDVKYDTTASINNVSYIELTDDVNPSWRDNTGASTDAYDVSDHSSVNYHVREEMKQLVKAISNVIFELDLNCSDTVLYSSENQIDYEDKVISYYVSETYLNYIKDASSLTIKKIVFADTATSNKHKDESITLTKTYVYKEATVTSGTFDSTKHYIINNGEYVLASSYVEGTKYYELNEIDVANAVTITPEEHAYTANYSIRFIRIDNTITTFTYASMYYAVADTDGEPTASYTSTTNSRTIPYYGSKITFNVTASLPDGMDLKAFFSITGQPLDDTWEFDPDTDNNGIISNGSANIVVNVDISMSQGSKAFVLKIYDQSKTINITKDPNRNALITSFGYDGTDYTSAMQTSQTSSSTILFGRAFNYTDLTAPYIKTTDQALNDDKVYYVQTGTNNSYAYTRVLTPVVEDIATYYEANPDFYLYQFSISPNATVAISATKTIADATGLMTYTVSYVVKSEYGTTQTYTHVLTEHLYFDDDTIYGTLYKAGEAVESEGIYTNDFNYGDDVIDGSLSNLTYDDSTANYVAVIFNRGYEPQYRIRYNLSYFYGDITHYTVTQGESNSSRSEPQDTYAGITITIDEDQQPGTYKFTYVYTNTGEWTSEGSYVHPTGAFDANETYYLYSGGNYVVTTAVTSATYDMLKSYIYIYQSSGDPSYTRTYEFPSLYIIKDYAIDALFHKLSFLDESIVLGGTASVMLPSTPISAGDSNTDSDAIKYDSVFASSSNNDIKINPNSIDYKNGSDAASITDYYTVGTVSDTDLEYYAPTIKIEDHAQVFKYTTLTKLRTYGADNNQSVKDSTILTTRDDMLLYVPFATGTGNSIKYEVFLVLVDSNMNWKKVYPKNFNGVDTNDSKVIKAYTTTFGLVEAEATPSLTEFSYTDPDTNASATYRIADFAGSTDVTSSDSKNISLYMDYIGDPLEDHFWYISYVVFSEYYLYKGKTDNDPTPNGDGVDDLGAIRFYHISIVDASNTVYFDVSLYAPTDFKLDEIYITFAENVYDDNGVSLGSYQLSCYLEKAKDDNNNLIYGAANTEEAGLVLYNLKFSMAALPAGYFTFSIDLPNGYGAICYTNKDNELDKTKEPGKGNPDSYLPHTTIIPITIGLKIIVSELTEGTTSVWAVNTSDLYTRRITYKGKKDF